MSTVDRTVKPQQDIQTTLWYAFLHAYHLDHSNAPIHCAPVRYSPLTFRLAEHLWQNPEWHRGEELRSVILDTGLYPEDPGR